MDERTKEQIDKAINGWMDGRTSAWKKETEG